MSTQYNRFSSMTSDTNPSEADKTTSFKSFSLSNTVNWRHVECEQAVFYE